MDGNGAQRVPAAFGGKAAGDSLPVDDEDPLGDGLAGAGMEVGMGVGMGLG